MNEPSWTKVIGLGGAGLTASYALGRLVDGAGAPTVGIALIGVAITVVLRRRTFLAIGISVVGVLAAALWVGLRTANGSGSPTLRAVHALRLSLHASRTILVQFDLPLPHTSGLLFLCGLFGGLVAIGIAYAGTRHPMPVLGIAVVLVVWSTVLLPTPSAALSGLVLGACALLVADQDHGRAPRTSVVWALSVLGAAALTLGWGPVVGSQGATPGGSVVPAVVPSALSLTTNLTGVEARDAHVVLFRAASKVPTYWQVASLAEFSGSQWVPDAATQAFLSGGAAQNIAVNPVGSTSFTTHVTIAAYSGRLLPAPPDTFSVSGPANPNISSFGVAAPQALPIGGSYTTLSSSPQPAVDISTTAVASQEYTALGPIAGEVRSLALSITGSQTALLDKSEALVNFFRSGRFHYAITAPGTTGAVTLQAFLTRTRIGSCEQFAGAFAVLARASGLPTRVVVGFTPGIPDNGEYVVRGSDAHAWPQVLIAGRWVSFEPTPQLPSGELSPPGVLGPAGLGRPTPALPPAAVPTAPPTTTPVPASPRSTVSVPVAAIPVNWVVVLVVLGAACIMAGLIVALWRHNRRRTPIDVLKSAWRSIDRSLARSGLGRPAWRTPMAHVQDLSMGQQGDGALATLGDIELVASLLEVVTYGQAVASPSDAEHAARASRRACVAIRSGSLVRLKGGRSPARPADAAGTSPTRVAQ